MIRIVAYQRLSDQRIIVRHPNGYMYITATSKLPTIYNSGYHCYAFKSSRIKNVDDAVNSGELELIDLVDIKWIHPHLLKPIKEQLKKYL